MKRTSYGQMALVLIQLMKFDESFQLVFFFLVIRGGEEGVVSK